MRKRLLIWSIATVMLSSCTEDDNHSFKEDGPQAIEFGQLETRAEITSKEQILEFGVCAQMNLVNDNNPQPNKYVDLLTNERVYRDTSTTPWDYDNKRYWVADRTFRFLGVYPYMEGAIESATLTQNGVSQDGYRVAFANPTTSDTDEMNDLMTAKNKVVLSPNQTNYNTPVTLTFNHALSKVSFKVTKDQENEADEVKITSITLGGIWKTGTLCIVPESSVYTDNWDFYGATTTGITKTFSDTEITVGGTDVMSNLLLIPQTIPVNAIRLTIGYTFRSEDGQKTKSLTAQTFLPEGEWKPNYVYNYTIHLAAETSEIKVATPQASVWGKQQLTGTIIIQ